MHKVITPKELLEKISQDGEGTFDPQLGIPFDTPPLAAPAGQAWVYNRWSQVFSITFDGHEERWGPCCYRLCHRELAIFAERKGYLKYDPTAAGTFNIRALVTQDDKLYGAPLPPDTQRPAEVLHRDGQEAPTQVTLVPVQQ